MGIYDYYGANNMPTVPGTWNNMAMQPVPQMMQPIQASEDKLVWVRGGEKAVQSYPQAPGRTGYYTDFDEPILVKKVTNNNGQIAELKVFDLVERPGASVTTNKVEQEIQQGASFVSNKDFSDFKNDINASIQNLMQTVIDMNNKLDTKPHYQGNRKQVNNNG